MEKNKMAGVDGVVREAQGVLDGNRTELYTAPSLQQYPHQWNWDTGFVSIGRSPHDQARAEKEMLSLLRGQWRTGMLPHILFDPSTPKEAYFPGPDFWQSDRSPEAPRSMTTTGLTHPPIHAFAALEIHRRASDPAQSRNFLRALYPGLVALHDHLRERRCFSDEGLMAIVHPWESGMDNSPSWDTAMAGIQIPAGALPAYRRRDLVNVDPRDRPSSAAYEGFVYLASLYRSLLYDDRAIGDLTPFLIEEPMTNSVWALSSHALAEIAGIVGQDGRRFEEDAQRIVRGIERKLWDETERRFFPFGLRAGGLLEHHSVVSFMPLIAPGLETAKAQALVAGMEDVRHCQRPACDCADGPPEVRGYLIPSYDVHDESFDPRRYWRGPIWVNVNWLLSFGCRHLGVQEKAEELSRAIVELVEKNGFYEYFDVHGARGYGADRFSWTAALYLDVALERARAAGSRPTTARR